MGFTNLIKFYVILSLAVSCSNSSEDKPGARKPTTQSGLPGSASNAAANPTPTPAITPTPVVVTPTVQPTTNPDGTPISPLKLQLLFNGGGVSCERWDVQISLDNQTTGSLVLSSKDGFNAGDSAVVQTGGKLLVVRGQTKGQQAHVNFTAPVGASLMLTSSLLMKCNDNDTRKDVTTTVSVQPPNGLPKSLISQTSMSLTLISAP